VLRSTVVPPIKPSVAYFTAAVGLLGTTITPYLFFWQTAGEREERRGVEQMSESLIDVSSGMVVSNFVAYFIVVSTASTLYIHHKSVQTAADAARALEPFAGQFATVIFSVGVLGAGLLAIPVLAVSTGYIVAGTFGWRMGLGRQAFMAPGFYTVITLSLLTGVELAITGINPIKALFYSQVLDGLIAPIILALMVILVSRRRLMGDYVAGLWNKVGGWAAVAVMTLADLALLYSLVHGG
jgi:Mn2+/Fe2+ NRAMP family transporter